MLMFKLPGKVRGGRRDKVIGCLDIGRWLLSLMRRSMDLVTMMTMTMVYPVWTRI